MVCEQCDDKTCPVCTLEEQRTVQVFLPMVMWVNNNVYCKEFCVLCGEWFRPGITLYEIPKMGYVCHGCVGRHNVKTDHLDMEVVKKVQERFLAKIS